MNLFGIKQDVLIAQMCLLFYIIKFLVKKKIKYKINQEKMISLLFLFK